MSEQVREELSELWLVAFLKTQLIEVLLGLSVLWVLSRSRAPHSSRGVTPHHSLSQRSLILFSASAITHPPLWFILPSTLSVLGIKGYLAYVVIGEVMVTLVEATWYRSALFSSSVRPWLSGLGLSIGLNGVSACYGLYESGALARW